MPPYSSSVPWRGLAWALLAAVLAHAIAVMLVTSKFHFSFHKAADNASITARVIEPVPASLLPPAGTAPPVGAPQPDHLTRLQAQVQTLEQPTVSAAAGQVHHLEQGLA